jgi:hypothetical protein
VLKHVIDEKDFYLQPCMNVMLCDVRGGQEKQMHMSMYECTCHSLALKVGEAVKNINNVLFAYVLVQYVELTMPERFGSL